MAETAGDPTPQLTIVPNRLLILGDSLAMGAAEVSNSDVVSFVSPAYPEMLRTLFPQLDIVSSCGVRYDTNVALKQIPQLLQTHRPAAVLLAVGGSDVDVDWRKTILSNGKRNRSRVSLEDYEKNLREIVRFVSRAGVKPILVECTSCDMAMRGAYFGKLSGVDVPAIIAAGGGQETNDARVSRYREALRRVAGELRIEFVAFPPALATEDPHIIYTEDGVHLSVAAHRHLAAAFAIAIRHAFELRDGTAVA
jgi:lysophospholipase L1-like esterase